MTELKSFDREAFDHAAMMAGSHNRAGVLAELLSTDISDEELREVLAYQWPMVDGSRAFSRYGAHREDGEAPLASVWGSWVWPEAVLGYFNGRGEREVIVARPPFKPVLVAQAVSASG